jgi:hypothetical protein
MTELEKTLAKALKEAIDHLDYCGYGDSWERECAHDSGLPDRLETAMAKAREAGFVDDK